MQYTGIKVYITYLQYKQFVLDELNTARYIYIHIDGYLYEIFVYGGFKAIIYVLSQGNETWNSHINMFVGSLPRTTVPEALSRTKSFLLTNRYDLTQYFSLVHIKLVMLKFDRFI